MIGLFVRWHPGQGQADPETILAAPPGAEGFASIGPVLRQKHAENHRLCHLGDVVEPPASVRLLRRLRLPEHGERQGALAVSEAGALGAPWAPSFLQA